MATRVQGPDAAGVRYTLVGVVEHRGSQLSSGHYSAYVQRGLQATARPAGSQQPSRNASEASEASELTEASSAGHSQSPTSEGSFEDAASLEHDRRWFYVSDATVSPSTQEAVAACEAYILLYMRCS